jgi:hypothetical protein
MDSYTPIDVRVRRFDREPEILFGVFDLLSPLARWEAAVGRISSHVAAAPEGFGLSAWGYRLLEQLATHGLTQKYRDEMALEIVRRTHYPEVVSRLDCVFLFPDRDTAIRATTRWGWPERHVSEVAFWPSNSTKVDTEWISERMGRGTDGWYEPYWSGKPCNESPLHELLSMGVGIILDKHLRAAAYNGLLAEFPKASRLLSGSATAFWCGCDTAGQMRYAAVRSGPGLHVAPFIYMGDFESGRGLDLDSAYARCLDDGAVFPLAPGVEELDYLELPDLRPWSFDVAIPDDAETLATVPHD